MISFFAPKVDYYITAAFLSLFSFVLFDCFMNCLFEKLRDLLDVYRTKKTEGSNTHPLPSQTIQPNYIGSKPSLQFTWISNRPSQSRLSYLALNLAGRLPHPIRILLTGCHSPDVITPNSGATLSNSDARLILRFRLQD